MPGIIDISIIFSPSSIKTITITKLILLMMHQQMELQILF